MKGLIFINPFLIPEESVRQAERLKAEFNALRVDCEIVSGGDIDLFIKDGAIKNEYACDFAVYLDKDKYRSGALKKAGVKLFNSHDAIRLCDDKAETYIALSNNGINIPDTVFGTLCYNDSLDVSVDFAEKIAQKLGFPVVVKESFGSMGKGVYLASDVDQLKSIMRKVKCKPHLFQKYLGYKRGTDVRILVIGGKAVAAIERHNETDFRSNVALGGTCKKITPPDAFIKAAEKCAKILKLDYCGVDVLYGEKGEPFVCEVNSNAFFFGLEKATGVNAAKLYAEYIIKTVSAHK